MSQRIDCLYCGSWGGDACQPGQFGLPDDVLFKIQQVLLLYKVCLFTHTHSLNYIYRTNKVKVKYIVDNTSGKSGYKYSMILGYPEAIMAGVSDPACIKTISPPSFDIAASAV